MLINAVALHVRVLRRHVEGWESRHVPPPLAEASSGDNNDAGRGVDGRPGEGLLRRWGRIYRMALSALRLALEVLNLVLTELSLTLKMLGRFCGCAMIMPFAICAGIIGFSVLEIAFAVGAIFGFENTALRHKFDSENFAI